MQWWIEHRRPGQEIEYHLVETPDFLDKGFYRQVRSIEAFRHREMKRRFPFDKDMRPLYPTIDGMPIENCSVRHYDDEVMRHKILTDSLKKVGQVYPPIPTPVNHKSVWDFYKAIGYDYKKKRYLSGVAKQ